MKLLQSNGVKLNVSRYREFGNHMLHFYLLLEGYILIKHKANSNVTGIFKSRIKISERLQLVIVNLLDTNEVDYQNLRYCSEKEKNLFNELMTKTKLKYELNFDPKKMDLDETDLIDKFNVIKGEIMAGNDNAELLEEAQFIIKKLINIGKIDAEVGDDIIKELKNNV